jgi:hypothetical protein
VKVRLGFEERLAAATSARSGGRGLSGAGAAVRFEERLAAATALHFGSRGLSGDLGAREGPASFGARLLPG